MFAMNNWVGLKYFKQFLSNPYLFRLIRNTLLLGIYTLLWSFPAPIIFALLMDQLTSAKFKKAVQSISYMPYFISTVVIVGHLAGTWMGHYRVSGSAFRGRSSAS